MMISNKNKDISKSIEIELRNYYFWQKEKIKISDEIDKINSILYEVSAVSYDQVLQKSNTNNYESKVIHQITKKQELLEKLDLIDNKLKFVEEFHALMDLDDGLFIKRVLINRSIYETNDSIAVRIGLTESGIRYKISTIIVKTLEQYIELQKNKGGIIEQISARGP